MTIPGRLFFSFSGERVDSPEKCDALVSRLWCGCRARKMVELKSLLDPQSCPQRFFVWASLSWFSDIFNAEKFSTSGTCCVEVFSWRPLKNKHRRARLLFLWRWTGGVLGTRAHAKRITNAAGCCSTPELKRFDLLSFMCAVGRRYFALAARFRRGESRAFWSTQGNLLPAIHPASRTRTSSSRRFPGKNGRTHS